MCYSWMFLSRATALEIFKFFNSWTNHVRNNFKQKCGSGGSFSHVTVIWKMTSKSRTFTMYFLWMFFLKKTLEIMSFSAKPLLSLFLDGINIFSQVVHKTCYLTIWLCITLKKKSISQKLKVSCILVSRSRVLFLVLIVFI